MLSKSLGTVIFGLENGRVWRFYPVRYANSEPRGLNAPAYEAGLPTALVAAAYYFINAATLIQIEQRRGRIKRHSREAFDDGFII